MPVDTIPTTKKIYPQIKITKITDPNRFYAFPLLGFLVKFIFLIPVYIFLFVCTIANIFVLFGNSFVVFFTGRYTKVAYDLNLGILRLTAKVDYYFNGLTNKYPGFSFDIQDSFSVDIPFPENPNRWIAFPIFGGLTRIILLIPYYFYSSIVKNGVTVGLFISWAPVLFKQYYPDTTFELSRDSTRLRLSQWVYFAGLSDMYPSFWISMNHKQKKIMLLIAGVLLFLINSTKTVQKPQPNMHQSTPSKTMTLPR